MIKYNKTTKQNFKNINDMDFFEDMSNESRELFKRALSEIANTENYKIEKEIKDIEIPPHSRRHKIRMNRLFRERVGGSFLPFPEEDNLYERVRSKLIIKINKFLNLHYV